MAKRRYLRYILIPLTPLLIIVVLKIHEVRVSLTDEDTVTIETVLQEKGIALPAGGAAYAEELTFILSVQDAVLEIAPIDQGIPYNTDREPKDLFQAGFGLCYDRSRAIEKILFYGGFKTRHVAIYSKEGTGSAIRSILTPGVPSHAVTEVKTRSGWLVVDSNQRWVSLDCNRMPVSIGEINNNFKDICWDPNFVPVMNSIYSQDFVYVYGLYSRHGRFYPPYDFFPDINWGEFLNNLL